MELSATRLCGDVPIIGRGIILWLDFIFSGSEVSLLEAVDDVERHACGIGNVDDLASMQPGLDRTRAVHLGGLLQILFAGGFEVDAQELGCGALLCDVDDRVHAVASIVDGPLAIDFLLRVSHQTEVIEIRVCFLEVGMTIGHADGAEQFDPAGVGLFPRLGLKDTGSGHDDEMAMKYQAVEPRDEKGSEKAGF